MTTVNSSNTASDVYNAINAQGKNSNSGTSSSVEEAQNRFLKLLVTQLKNQDPLNPMDNAQMTSQMAQMSTVQGIEQLNATLNALVSDLGTSQSMQASSMIGKNVFVAGSRLELSEGIAIGGIKLGGAADQVTVKILDSTGKVVQTENLGAQNAGIVNFGWDGKDGDGNALAAGTYKIKVEATQGGKSVTAEPLELGTVNALVRSTNGFLLDLGSLGRVDFNQVQQIL